MGLVNVLQLLFVLSEGQAGHIWRVNHKNRDVYAKGTPQQIHLMPEAGTG